VDAVGGSGAPNDDLVDGVPAFGLIRERLKIRVSQDSAGLRDVGAPRQSTGTDPLPTQLTPPRARNPASSDRESLKVPEVPVVELLDLLVTAVTMQFANSGLSLRLDVHVSLPLEPFCTSYATPT